jgi:hypothetical protein
VNERSGDMVHHERADPDAHQHDRQQQKYSESHSISTFSSPGELLCLDVGQREAVAPRAASKLRDDRKTLLFCVRQITKQIIRGDNQ